jgi:hypothetical protein
MPAEPVRTRRLLHLVDAAEQEIRGHFTRVREPADVAEGRLSLARLEMRHGGRLKIGAFGEPTLAELALADYSARMAVSGLTRAARIAGMAHASSAATSISTMTDA